MMYSRQAREAASVKLKRKLALSEARHRPDFTHVMTLNEIDQRVSAKPQISYYHQVSKNRLFISHDQEHSAELIKLCGKAIELIDAAMVKYRREHDPFADEVELGPRI